MVDEKYYLVFLAISFLVIVLLELVLHLTIIAFLIFCVLTVLVVSGFIGVSNQNKIYYKLLKLSEETEDKDSPEGE
jgi:DNA integrity scanning protein DisA with diadenylate cyclase activity